MTPSTWTIKPGEKKLYEADASTALSAGDNIEEVAVELYDDDGTDRSALISGIYHTTARTYMKWFVDAATLVSGDKLWMKITVTTAKGESIKEEVKVTVKEKFTA